MFIEVELLSSTVYSEVTAPLFMGEFNSQEQELEVKKEEKSRVTTRSLIQVTRAFYKRNFMGGGSWLFI